MKPRKSRVGWHTWFAWKPVWSTDQFGRQPAYAFLRIILRRAHEGRWEYRRMEWTAATPQEG
jgi:hypothetical protein